MGRRLAISCNRPLIPRWSSLKQSSCAAGSPNPASHSRIRAADERKRPSTSLFSTLSDRARPLTRPIKSLALIAVTLATVRLPVPRLAVPWVVLLVTHGAYLSKWVRPGLVLDAPGVAQWIFQSIRSPVSTTTATLTTVEVRY